MSRCLGAAVGRDAPLLHVYLMGRVMGQGSLKAGEEGGVVEDGGGGGCVTLWSVEG